MRSDQEVFDLVARALIQQGRPSVQPAMYYGAGYSQESYLCLYRSEEGCKCAAGHLIPDAKYNLEMEGMSIKSVIEAFDVDLDASLDLVQELQNTHDRAAVDNTDPMIWLTDWRSRMSTLAAARGLDAAVLSEAS